MKTSTEIILQYGTMIIGLGLVAFCGGTMATASDLSVLVPQGLALGIIMVNLSAAFIVRRRVDRLEERVRALEALGHAARRCCTARIGAEGAHPSRLLRL